MALEEIEPSGDWLAVLIGGGPARCSEVDPPCGGAGPAPTDRGSREEKLMDAAELGRKLGEEHVGDKLGDHPLEVQGADVADAAAGVEARSGGVGLNHITRRPDISPHEAGLAQDRMLRPRGSRARKVSGFKSREYLVGNVLVFHGATQYHKGLGAELLIDLQCNQVECINMRYESKFIRSRG